MQNTNMKECYNHNLKSESGSHNLSIFLDWFLLISFPNFYFLCLINGLLDLIFFVILYVDTLLRKSFPASTKAVISMHYLAMKIPTAREVMTTKGDEQSAWGCYSVAFKLSFQIGSHTLLQGYHTSMRSSVHLTDGHLLMTKHCVQENLMNNQWFKRTCNLTDEGEYNDTKCTWDTPWH